MLELSIFEIFYYDGLFHHKYTKLILMVKKFIKNDIKLLE